MTKITNTILILAIASVLVAGALTIVPAVYAPSEKSPAKGGVPPGLPFQNLQANIDELAAQVADDLAEQNADLQSQIDDLQDQIDLLSDDVDANADAIEVLEDEIALRQNLITGSCPVGFSIRVVNADGTVVCEFDSSGATLLKSRPFASVSVPNGGISTASVSCPAGFTITGGGYSGTTDLDVIASFSSGNSWRATGDNNNFGFGSRTLFAVADCIRIL